MAISSGQQAVGQRVSRARLVRGRLWAAARVAALVAASMAFVLVVAGLVPYAAPSAATSRRQDLGSALSVVAVVLLVVTAVRAARVGWGNVNGWVYAASSTRQQRARALAAVRGNQAVPEPEVALTVAVADAAAREGKGAPFWVALALMMGTGALGRAPWWLALMMIAVAAAVVLAAITTRDAHQARRWLRNHRSTAA